MVESIVESSTEEFLNVAKTERIKVLHVDDDQTFLKVAKQCLDIQGGFEVDTACSVNEALEKLKKTDYDAVVSDYQMPGKDGLRFLKELRQKGDKIPFIVFTGKGREEIAIEALNLGADGYFNKSGHPETVCGELAHGMRQVVGRRRAEQSFLKSEDKYRRLVETLREGIWVIDKDSRTTFVNPRMAEILGYDTEEMKGRHLFSFMDERGVEIAKRLLERRKQNIKEQHDFEFLRKDGTRVYATLETAPITDDNGNYIGALASVMDITERKRVEKALRESEERLRSIFENSSDQIFMLDRDCRFLSINQTAADLSRMSPQEMIGMSISGIFPETIAAQFLRNIKNVFDTGKSMFIDEKMVVKGRELYNSTSLNPVRDDRGRVIAVTGIVRDITERKKTEKQLRDSEKKYRELFETSIDAIATSDMDGHFIDCNQSCQKMLGYSLDEMKKLTYQQLTPEKWLEKEAEIIEKEVMKKGYTAGYEKELIRKDGAIIPVSNRVWATFDDDGKPKAMWGIVRDITERRKAQEELRNSEEYLSVLFELAPDAYYLNDLKGNFIDGNKAAEEVTGYARNELVGKSFLKLKLLSRSQALKAAKLLAMNALGKPTGPDEFVLNRKDGTQVSVEIRTHPVKIKNQTLVLGIARDITIRKKDEKTIRESQQKFEGLFRHNPEAAVYLDLDSKVLDVNPRFCELFGYSAKEVEGKQINEVVVPEDMIEEAEALDKDAKKGYASHDTVRKRKDGSLVHVSISASPVTVEGRLLGYVGVYKDITELKNAEECLKKMNKRLEITNEKLHVVGGLTRHDVRNKLSAVTGNAYLLKRKLTEDPKALEQLTDMEAAVRLVERIFEFARVYERLGVEQLASMDVGKAVDEAVSLFSDLKGVRIVNECGGLTVLADSLLRQLFYNLVDNSLKYGEKIQQIKIHYRTPSADQFELVYEDDGVGIPDKMRSNLFKEGFTSGKGTGYGLFMIKRICEVYGWTIRETGNQGKGAQFTMLIPRIGSTGKANYQIQNP
jgi:PAS domain S-box-containing protein